MRKKKLLKKINCRYIIEQIFNHLQNKKMLELIKDNKRFQKI